MQQQSTAIPSRSTMRLNPVALVIAFGVAGVIEVILFGVVMGAMWGMTGGGGMHGSAGGGPSNGGGWMMGGGGGTAYGGGSMMGGGFGFAVFALFWGALGGAIAGGVSAWVYNNVIPRNTA